nr:site-2 protease family protein [Actinomycetota bacterium]
HLGRALSEAPELEPSIRRMQGLLEANELGPARSELSSLEAAVARAELSEPAARGAERGLTELGDALGPDAYWRGRAWRKIAVIAAGPLTNLLFAFAALAAVFMLGVPVDTTRAVESVLAGSPAHAIGLRAGDEIVALNGVAVAPDHISETIRASRGRQLRLTVLRDGRRVALRPARAVRRDGALRLGFALAAKDRSYGFVESLGLASDQVWEVTKGIGSSLAGLVSGENRKDVASAVGIVQGSSQAVEAGFTAYLSVLALISLSLALLNLLPLLPLDGGHIVFSLIEGLRGRGLGREVYERVSIVGLALVLFLFAIGLSNDIGRLSGG